MLTFQEEYWDAVEEIKEYLEEHFEEAGVFSESLPLEPAWDLYEEGSRTGKYIILTARDEERTLVGYTTWWIGPHSYHSGYIVAISDMVYLAPDYRGPDSMEFIQWSEEELYSKHGADIISIGMHVKKDFSGMLEHLGYEKTAIVCSKHLGN